MTDSQSPVGLSIPLNQPRPDFYSRSYFQGLSRITALNERAIWAVISILGKPEGYLDLGCGDGSMVAAINSISGGSIGVELSEAAREVAATVSSRARILVKDLRNPCELRGPFSLVTCIDVAPWIDKPNGTFWYNVCNHVSDWLVWTGTAYRQELEERGLTYCARQTADIAYAWSRLGERAWMADEVLVMRRIRNNRGGDR